MSENKRTSNKSYADDLSSPGPYIGRVVNNIDPMRQGSLEVELLRRVGNQPSANQQLFTVRYLSPFYGVTGVEHNGSDNYDFNHTQKSYGFWAVPPDPGTLVMVIFVDSDPGQGYWIGCVQDAYMNHMIPGLAANKNFTDTVRENDTEQWTGTTRSVTGAFGSDIEQLPVGEINRLALRNQSPQANVDANKKPVHPIADTLSLQGTIKDKVRGTHTSSARRDSPSNVYGISTPGPIDKRTNAQKGKIGRKNNTISTFVSRLGGHSIVMDDGNDRKLRKGKPWEEPYEYVDLEQGATDGLVNFPEDESFRIRTRTGHQILLHNSEDLVYITNARGTAWIELTSNGKIDIYAKDSISIRTEQDFNFVASRDFNVHAGRAINLFAVNTTSMASGNDVSINSRTTTTVASEGPMNLGSTGGFTFTGQIENFEITTNNFRVTANQIDLKSTGDVKMSGNGNVEFKAIQGSFIASSQSSMNLLTATEMNIQQKEMNILTYGDIKIGSSTGKIHIIASGDNVNLQGTNVNLNSPGAAIFPTKEAVEARAASGATQTAPPEGRTEGQGGGVGGNLTLYPLPGVGQVIVKRAPTAEPYAHHENFNPAGFTPDLTDRENPSMPYGKDDPQLEIRSSDDAENVPAELGGNAGYDGDSRAGAAGGGGGAVYHQNTYAPNMSQTHNDRINEGRLAKMPQDWAQDKEFLAKVQELAGSLGANFIDLLTLMMFETAWTMSPSKWNGYGYVGLIQFGNAAAKDLKITTGQLAAMSRVQQMEYVKKYFERWVGITKVQKPMDLGTLYMLVAYPAYSKFPSNQVIAARGGPKEKMWQANPGWRSPKNSNGPITRQSIGQAPEQCRPYVIAMLEKAGYAVPGGSGGPGVTPNAPTAGHGAKPPGSVQTVSSTVTGRAAGPV